MEFLFSFILSSDYPRRWYSEYPRYLYQEVFFICTSCDLHHRQLPYPPTPKSLAESDVLFSFFLSYHHVHLSRRYHEYIHNAHVANISTMHTVQIHRHQKHSENYDQRVGHLCLKLPFHIPELTTSMHIVVY